MDILLLDAVLLGVLWRGSLTPALFERAVHWGDQSLFCQ